MLVHSLFLLCLASLLLYAAESSILSSPAQTEPLAGRRPSLESHRGDVPDLSAGGDGQNTDVAQRAIAVRKMRDNEGEMFFQDYWQFDQDADDWNALQSESKSTKLQTTKSYDDANGADPWTNTSLVLPFQAPFALHRDPETSPSYAHWARGLLLDRAFHCPNATDACTGISRPNSCCPSGSSCQLVTDTGQGDVACCGSGQTCSGNVQACAEGYQNCPSAAGGGCCVPGYACVGTIGCAHSSTTTVIVNPQITASPPASSTSASPSSATTTTPLEPLPLPPGTTSTSQTTTSTTLISTATSSSSPITTTTTTTPPAQPSSTASNAFVAPARPTSAAIVTTHFLSASPPACPTGFYQCSAYYHGGCCRVGRDCGLTDCPSSASTTVAQGDGVTVVAPTGLNRGGGGGCASGWQTCGADLGGGCCPPGGYECGTQSCTKGPGSKITGTGGVSVAKGDGGGTSGAGERGLGVGVGFGWVLSMMGMGMGVAGFLF